MKTGIIIFLFFFSLISFGKAPEVISYQQLEERINSSSDTLYCINFWATWCPPCVEELPDFIKLDKTMENKAFKMLLISLDFPGQVEKRVIPFLKENNIVSEVLILDDDPNVWINKVNSEWSGTIPATLFVMKNQREFYSQQLNYKQLISITETFKTIEL